LYDKKNMNFFIIYWVLKNGDLVSVGLVSPFTVMYTN